MQYILTLQIFSELKDKSVQITRDHPTPYMKRCTPKHIMRFRGTEDRRMILKDSCRAGKRASNLHTKDHDQLVNRNTGNLKTIKEYLQTSDKTASSKHHSSAQVE